MSMLLVPRPIRELVVIPIMSKMLNDGTKRAGNPGVSLLAGLGQLGFGYTWIKSAGRVAVVALAALTLLTTNISLPIAAAVGCALSFPSVLIMAGSYAAHTGLVAIIGSLWSGSFAALGMGVLSLAGGWVALENHDYDFLQHFGFSKDSEHGFIDHLILHPLATQHAGTVTEAFN